MAAASSRSDLLHLEADFLQAQFEIVQGLSRDIHFISKILNFKVYDNDRRIASLRKAAWETRTKSARDGDTVVEGQNKEDERRLKGVLKNATALLETARQVKTGLEALTVVVCERQELVPTSTQRQERTQGNAAIESEKVKALREDLPSLEETLTKELPSVRQAFVESSRFIAVNFHAVSSKVPREEIIETCKVSRAQHVKNTAAESTVVPGNFVSTMDGDHPRSRGRGTAPGRKVSNFSHVELPRRSSIDDRSRSPAGSRQAGKQQEEEGDLLGWIPKKVGIARLPVDEELRALMMQEMKKRRDRAR